MRSPKRRRNTTAAALLSLALAVPLGAQALAAPGPDNRPDAPTVDAPAARSYEVLGISTQGQRTALTAHGAAIDAVDDHSVTVTADRATAETLRGLGYHLTEPVAAAAGDAIASAPSEYTSYAEAMETIEAAATQYPDLVSTEVIGTSHEGRDIVAVKVSSEAAVDRDKPEVLFTHNMHGREHLTTEMALYTLAELTSGYGTDTRVTELLDERELWIIPIVNPDGKAHDMDSGQFRMWRKNREPDSGSSAIGTDLNRNFAHQWGCCGGSSTNPGSETYRGHGPESAKETQVIADFVRGRVVDGEQQITAHIDFHTYSELILWPYGYTYDDTAPGLTQDDRDAFAAVGEAMADSNGYRPQQSSDLYVTDGSVNDWMWADQGIFSYTFEMYPRSASGGGFYPPGSVIDRETSRNREAVLILMENADCMYRSIGKKSEYCAA
ncbi:M14 family metallopeptidase [Streptomyces otsuchiensis]|uniref:M14 family metallopeptidase n=1 Tax=Streptomyces otsuchiensis TaxID=2681388 RepID=UPI001D1321E7|nr:M14 family metallopeptidase [Streptomyces otsuchiensis]